jgi:hypothetical protein
MTDVDSPILMTGSIKPSADNFDIQTEPASPRATRLRTKRPSESRISSTESEIGKTVQREADAGRG